MAKYTVCVNCERKIYYGDSIIGDFDTDQVFCCEDCFVDFNHGEKLSTINDEDYDSWFDHDDELGGE